MTSFLSASGDRTEEAGVILWTVQFLCAFAKLRKAVTLATSCLYFFININQLDALHFIVSLFQASTCFEHMCSSSGGQKLYYTASGIITPIGGCLEFFTQVFAKSLKC